MKDDAEVAAVRARWGWPAVLFFASFASCGGEVTYELAVRPRQDDFAEQIQPIFNHLGCSPGGGCHATGVGELFLVESPDAAQIDRAYQSVRSKLDLERPERSVLVAVLLSTDLNPAATHDPVCFTRLDGCAYRKLLAWIAWEKPGDPRPQDVACDYSGDTCVRR